jgi:glucosamine--fructose-6-phosphate aminotransferase (isomerizing)
MCGIVGAVAGRNVVPILLEGLRRLEYRGYDSAGIAILDAEGKLDRVRSLGKVVALTEAINNRLSGHIGIAHTRWATHGEPSQSNAHPHICRSTVSVVHNGIIENHEQLRKEQKERGFEFTSETDTEVVVHQIYGYHVDEDNDLLTAVRAAVKDLEGAYALGVISAKEKGRMIATRRGSPLVIGRRGYCRHQDWQTGYL